MVYVDRLKPCIPTSKWPFTFSCHLLADTEMELHQFARRLGLKRAWFQREGILPHYDLTPTKRNFALRTGATEIDRKELYQRILCARAKGGRRT